MDRTTSFLIFLLACGIVAFGLALILEHPTETAPVTALQAPTVVGYMAAPASTPAPGQAPVIPAKTSCSPLTITQTDGTDITFPCMPQRIIAANANAAEMLIALGAEDRIVGATDSTFAVPYIKNKIPHAARIGDWQTPNIEQMLSLKPDVVISYSTYRPRNADQITAHNITIVSLDCYKLSTLASDARALGKLTGKSNTAEVYARMVEDTIAEVRIRAKKIPNEKYPSVYFESYSDLTASAPGSGSDELVTNAGGENIAAGLTSSSVKISPEWVVSQKPAFIFKAVSASNTKSLEEIMMDIKTRTGWAEVPAVKNDRVYAFSNEIIYGPRAYIGLVYTAQILHPAEFRDMHPRTLLTEYDRTYVAGTNRTGMIYP